MGYGCWDRIFGGALLVMGDDVATYLSFLFFERPGRAWLGLVALLVVAMRMG